MSAEKEQKLRETAEKIIETNSLEMTGMTPEQFREERENHNEAHIALIDTVVECMKSDASKEYHDKGLKEEVKELLAYLNIHNSIDEEEGHQIIMRIEKILNK